VHFIVEGEVAIVRQSETNKKQSRIITTLHNGDSFGEMELIDIQNCAASVVTLAPSRIITLSNKDLYKISLVDLKTYTMLILNLARDISRRLRGADEMLAMVKNRATMPTSASQSDASV
jgi:CRP-like cAMP-binding protein